MPTFVFEAMDATGQEIKDEIEAATQEEAQQTIRQMGYFVTRISVRKEKTGAAGQKGQKKRAFVIGGASSAQLTLFTRQLSILQDAGLPILRSLRILEGQSKPGALKNALTNVCDEIEAGSTLSEAMAKSPKVFNRLYVNMIKAGEAGGALETILRRLAEFMERAQSLKKKVQGAMIYPIVVTIVAVVILAGIMYFIVPVFIEMFEEFEIELPTATKILVSISHGVVHYWYLIPLIPIAVILFVAIVRKFKTGKMGWDLFILKVPVLGKLVEKNVLARTTRTLGTLVTSGVPIIEGLTITRETAGNAMFERMFAKITDAIRDGDTVARPMKEYSVPGFHPIAMFFWIFFMAGPLTALFFMPIPLMYAAAAFFGMALIAGLLYLARFKSRVVDDIVVNMVDVGEETGELDTMLYKVSDVYDEEVRTLTDGMMKLIEPLLIVGLGTAIGFIVISLFLPLIEMINQLS
ncbi:MAG: type II secretion system F family protein [Pirellulaceae bacterium]